MATSPAVPSTDVRDIFSGFVLLDWAFVLLTYLLLLYLFLQVGLLVLWPGRFSFDFLPLVNGALVIPIAWGGVRLDRRMHELVVQLDRGSVVVVDTPEERETLLATIAARSFRYGWIGTVAISCTMFAGILSYTELLFGGRISWAQGQIVGPTGSTVALSDAAIMLAVCMPASALAGRFLGKIVANSRLLDTLHDLGHDLSSFAGEAGLQTMRTIEAIFTYSANVTVSLTAVLCSWWIAFTLQLTGFSQYSDWRYPYLWFWVLSFAAFLTAVFFPVRAFRRRLDEIHGGAAATAEASRQASEARQDARLLRSAIEAAMPLERPRLQRRLKDLEAFIITLETRSLRRPLLNPFFLYAWIAMNIIAITAPALLAQDFGRGPPAKRAGENGILLDATLG